MKMKKVAVLAGLLIGLQAVSFTAMAASVNQVVKYSYEMTYTMTNINGSVTENTTIAEQGDKEEAKKILEQLCSKFPFLKK